jgi:hypothetical protein
MGDGDSRNLAGPASGLLLVAALFAGWLWLPSPMRSFRPEAPAARVVATAADEDVPARLWEDPFSAVERVRGAAGADTGGTGDQHWVSGEGGLRNQLGDRLSGTTGESYSVPEMTVLAVMVEGGWYAEQVEERRKQRQAVVSALGLRGFVPESADHIGFTTAADGADTKADSASGQALEVPFEWFERVLNPGGAPSAPREVLVLWIDEGRCATSSSGLVRPLGRLEDLIERLLDRTEDLEKGHVQFVVLGPATSTTLLALIRAQKDNPRGAIGGSLLECADVISTRATAPLDVLRARAGIPEAAGAQMPEQRPAPIDTADACQPRHGPIARPDDSWLAGWLGVRSFTSTIADDRKVIRTILRELDRRGVDLDEPSNRIALVGEWDTAYARTLGDLVRAEIIDLAKDDEIDPEEHAQVESFRYLRGIDGQLPGEKPKRAADQTVVDPSDPNLSERERITAMERPQGRSQLDAIQRLADRLKRHQRELRRSGARLAAIGVVGSDLYDKELILQALHSSFADSVFFTTDLDARLIHPSQYAWARNLVIGSSYGLELHPDLQASLGWWVPPFRSCYQASTFVGCLLAVAGPGGHIPDPEMAERVRIGASAPRLFEVARSGAWDLSEPEGSATHLHPDPPAKVPFALSAMWLAAALVGTVLVVASPRLMRRTSPHCWPPDPREVAQLRRARWLSAAVAVALVAVIWISATDPGGEPFAILEGISIWPTEILRLVAGVFSIVALVHAAGDLRQSHRRLAQRYGLPEDTADADEQPLPTGESEVRPLPGLLQWLRLSSWRDDRDLGPCDENDPARAVPVAGLWRVYLQLGRSRIRWRRVWVELAGLIAVLALMMSGLGRPVVPARGALAMWADRVVLVGSVLGVWLLTLWVFDVTRLSEKLVRWFATRATIWPPAAVERIRAETGLEGFEAAEVLEVRLIAEHTDVVSRLVVPPFVAVFLMILSRTGLFDGWTWPLAIVAVFVILFGFCLGSAVMLRLAAERARRATLASLRRRQIALVADESKEAARRSRQIELAIENVEGIRQGAFARWSQHPILRAVLLPFGGAGALWAMDLLSKLGF